MRFVLSKGLFTVAFLSSFLTISMPTYALKEVPNVLISDVASPNLDLETAMNMAEDFAFNARVANYSWEMAEEKSKEPLRSMLPNVSGNGNFLTYDTGVNPAIGTSTGSFAGLPPTSVQTVGVTLSQPIVGIVPLFFNLQQANASARKALHNKNQSRVDARYLGASTYINAIKAKKLVSVALSAVDVSQTQLKDAQAQFNAGKLTRADILKFKLSFENAKTNYLQAQTVYKVALINLGETIGITDLDRIQLPKKYAAKYEGQQARLLSLDQYLTMAFSLRSDLLASQANVDAAKYQVYSGYSTYLPSLNFVSTYSRNLKANSIVNPLNSSQRYSADQVQDTWFYGIQVNWNLLDWGVRQAQINQATAGKHVSLVQNEQARSQARIDVTHSFLKLKDAYQVLDSAKVSSDYARDAYSQKEAQFINGEATTTDVLSASSDKLTAEANLANAIGDLDLAWITLQRSVGSHLSVRFD